MNRNEIIELVNNERDRQDGKWGSVQHNTLTEWASILGEEYGELCREINRVHFGNVDHKELVEETIQVAAVCFAILEHLDPTLNQEKRQRECQQTSQSSTESPHITGFALTTSQMRQRLQRVAEELQERFLARNKQ